MITESSDNSLLPDSLSYKLHGCQDLTTRKSPLISVGDQTRLLAKDCVLVKIPPRRLGGPMCIVCSLHLLISSTFGSWLERSEKNRWS